MDQRIPMFSVIVPVYCVQDYLDECVESVLKQEYTDYELLLVDDGSPDDSGAICDKYALADRRVKVIHKNNGGLASARNAGIRAASGKWLLFLDSDDYYRSTAFFSQLFKKITGTSAQLVRYGLIQVRDRDNLVIKKVDFTGVNFHEGMSEDDKLEQCILKGIFSISACQYAVRAAFQRQNKLFFDESLKREEDIEWMSRVFLAAPELAVMKFHPYVYRVRSSSICTSVRESQFWQMRYYALEKSLRNIDRSGCTEEKKKILCQALAYFYYILLAEIADEPDLSVRREAYRKIRKLDRLRRYKGSKRTNLCRLVVNGTNLYCASRILNLYSHYRFRHKGQPIRVRKGK